MKISFAESKFSPVELPFGANLSEYLDISNSPVLFGCRTSICGTCLIEVEEGIEQLSPPAETERELLDIIIPNHPRARLACQIEVSGNIKIRYLGPQ